MKTIAAMLVLLLGFPLHVAIAQEKVDKSWLDEVAALKPAEQAKAVEAKLRMLNIQFRGGVRFRAEDDNVVEFGFLGNGVKNIGPLAVFKHLTKLNFNGTPPASENDK